MDIRLENISKSYPLTPVFRGLNVTFEEGKIHGILGASGSGKTTLLHLIGGITPFDQGSIIGVERVSCLFQRERLLPNLTVRGNVEFVLTHLEKNHRRAAAERALKSAHIEEAAALYPRELSGGMAQRVSMARAFAYPSDVLLRDEPFHALDLGLKLRLMRSLKDMLKADRRTVIFVTHDPDEALLLADDLFVFGKKPSGIVWERKLPPCDELRDLSRDEAVRTKKELTECLLSCSGTEE